MLSKLMLLIGLLVGLFITLMCVNENKIKLSQKYINNTPTQEVKSTPLIVSKEPIKEIKEVAEEKPPVILALDTPTFSYDTKDKGELNAKLSSKDKSKEIEEFMLSYCPKDKCTQNLSFEETTKIAIWKADALKISKFLKDNHIQNGKISIDDKAINIDGELKDKKQDKNLSHILKSMNLDNLELKNNTTIQEKVKKVEEPVKEDPISAKVSVEQTQNKINQLLSANPIYFQFNSSNLTQDSKSILDKVASLLAYVKDIHITIEGHTDSLGKASYNKILSQKRAETVKKYLQNQNLINSINAIGYGEERPINSNPKDHINRRVEIKIKQGA